MLYLINPKTKKKERICSNVVLRTNMFSQGTGLMLHPKIVDQAHIFIFKKPRKIGITMLFMRFPIDLLYLDEKNKVIEIKENLKPWRQYNPKKKAIKAVEMSIGMIKKHNIKVGSFLEY